MSTPPICPSSHLPLQEFEDGAPLSSFTVVRQGRIVAHVTYDCGLTISAPGDVIPGFAGLRTTVDAPDTLAAASAFLELLRVSEGVAAPDFQFGLDFVRLVNGASRAACRARRPFSLTCSL